MSETKYKRIDEAGLAHVAGLVKGRLMSQDANISSVMDSVGRIDSQGRIFSTASARDAAIPSPKSGYWVLMGDSSAEGFTAYDVWRYNGSAWVDTGVDYAPGSGSGVATGITDVSKGKTQAVINSEVDESLSELVKKTNEISKETITSDDDEVTITTDAGVEVVNVSDAGVSVTGSLKKNGVEVLTSHQNLTEYAKKTEIPTKTSQLTNDSNYINQHQDISGKQDVISDLATIRSGAALGTTALQSHQDISGKADKTYVDAKLANKADNSNISSEEVSGLDDNEISIQDDDGVEVARLSSDGIMAKGFYYMDGSPITKAETKALVFWGDSLTEGNQAGDGGTTPKSMKELLGEDWTIYNFGRGGDLANSIACRQGGMNYVIKANQTIPASGSVTLDITDNIGSNTVGVRLSTSALGNGGVNNSLNPCYINGIKGKLERVSSSYPVNKAVFSRETNGEAVVLSRPTSVISNSVKYYDMPCIICIGQNEGFDTSKPDDYLAIVKAMVKAANTDKYLVVGMMHTKGLTYNWQKACNNLLQQEYGRKYIDVETYMKTPIYGSNGETIVSSYVLDDEGLTPTSEDLTKIANNIYPPSVMFDNLHFNKYGYECIAKLEYKRGKELGYW